MPQGRTKPSKFRVEVEIFGARAAADSIRNMGRRAYNTRPLMERIAQELATISRDRVESAPWAPLTEGTIARKESQGENTAILRDEWRPIKGSPTRVGDMLYTALTEEGAPGQLLYSTRTWAVFGVQSAGNEPLFYARFVQNVKGKKRRLLAIPLGDAVRMTELAANWITDGIGLGQSAYLTGSELGARKL